MKPNLKTFPKDDVPQHVIESCHFWEDDVVPYIKWREDFEASLKGLKIAYVIVDEEIFVSYKEILGESDGEMEQEHATIQITKKLAEALKREFIDVESRLWDAVREAQE